MKIVHLSDPHFGTVDEVVSRALKRALSSLKPDLVLMTGDITQRARASQFLAAKSFVDAVKVPVYSVPGNHDIPLFNLFQRFTTPYGRFVTYFSKDVDHLISRGDVAVALLNSTDHKRHINGVLNLDYVESKLRNLNPTARIRILGFHHPMDCPEASDEKNIVINHKALAELCSRYAIDLVLGGHIHNPITRLSVTRYPTLQRPFVISVGGTCLSRRTRPPAANSISVISVNPLDSPEVSVKLQIRRFELDESNEFTVKESFDFERTHGDGWQIESPP